MTRPIRVRGVGDIHAGSLWGVLPPKFKWEEQPYEQNDGQRWLWDAWMSMVETGPAPDITFVNGDVTDGGQWKSGGEGVISTNVDCQMAAAKEILAPLVHRSSQWYLIKGTRYHEQHFGWLADVLCATPLSNGSKYARVLNINVAGTKFNVAHRSGSGSAIYQGTIMDRELLWSIIQENLGKVPHADVILRSHTHCFGEFRANGRMSVVTPCWQLPTPYAEERNYFRWQPDIGWVDFVLTGDPTCPIIIEPHIFPLPPKTEEMFINAEVVIESVQTAKAVRLGSGGERGGKVQAAASSSAGHRRKGRAHPR